MKFALIGRGKMGTRWEAVIRKHASLDMIVDPNNLGTHTLKEVLKDKDIDAVLIATPHKYLASITGDVLESGKHVLCEKPGANKSSQIEANNMLANAMELVYRVGYNYRFHDGFIKARKLFEADAIGELVFIRAKHGFGGRDGYEKEWRINKDIGGGGHLHDQGVHMIDMAKSFMGEIKKVQGMRADNYWKAGTEDNGFVLLQDKEGATASIHSSLTQWKRTHTFEIYGTKGYLIVEGLGMRYGDGEKLIVGMRTKDSDVVKEEVIKCDSVADHSLELELKAFISEIEDPISRRYLDDPKEVLEIVETVYKNNKL